MVCLKLQLNIRLDNFLNKNLPTGNAYIVLTFKRKKENERKNNSKSKSVEVDCVKGTDSNKHQIKIANKTILMENLIKKNKKHNLPHQISDQINDWSKNK